MAVVLGIDAAWTHKEPSGVALVRTDELGRSCIAVAPSYESFLAHARGEPIDWQQPSFRGGAADPIALLKAAAELAGYPVDVIALDMPVATVPISSRRHADNQVSCEFGGRWCSAHTPNIERPGSVGATLSTALADAGYPIATSNFSKPGRCLLEVYPHPALLSLLSRPHRVPYKVSKSRKYWPNLSAPLRIDALLLEFNAILAGLVAYFGAIELQLPIAGSITYLARLKRYEDALDALVCAWVGAEHLAGRTTALGDDTSAIWCPSDVVFGSSLQ